MTYRCPSCSAKLVPEAGTSRLQCPGCFDFWRANGRGRLQRAQAGETMVEMHRAADAADEPPKDARRGLGYDRGIA